MLTLRGPGRGLGRVLVWLVPVQLAWALGMAASLSGWPASSTVTATVEALRPLAWSALLLAMLWHPSRRRIVHAGLAASGAIALLQLVLATAQVDPRLPWACALAASMVVLTCVEQVYRNASEEQRWSVKYLCLAIASMAAFDLILQGDALVNGQTDPAAWGARGFACALVVPLVAVTAARMPDWQLGIHVSRKVVFHSATLLAGGLYLLVTAVAAWGLALFMGDLGRIAQAVLLFAALVGLAVIAGSRPARARLRVLLAKHFFRYRYDYRTEWLRLTDLLAQPGGSDASLSSRALQGIAALVESPGGTLWLRSDDGAWLCDARRGVPEREPLAADDPLPRALAETGWIVDVDEWRSHPERYRDLPLPAALADDPDAWVVVPLVLHDAPIGFVQLRRPDAPIALDWEVRDMLKTAGRQAAGYLMVRDAVERLAQSRQFDSFNRMSAFVVHDLKNLVAQLGLLLKNAPRHRDNPEFQRDMLETVENVLDRMQGLLMQLRVGSRPLDPPAPVPLAEALRAALAAKKGLRVEPVLDIADDLEAATVFAHRDRLVRVVGHLLQNAAEASPSGAPVRIAVRRDGDSVVLEVIDSGRGMSRSFVESRLFRPFASTKEHGMGLGAFEVREYLREIGGTVAVDSVEGRGTTFRLHMPLLAARVATTEDA